MAKLDRHLNLMLDQETYDELAALAERNGDTVSKTTRKVIYEGLETIRAWRGNEAARIGNGDV